MRYSATVSSGLGLLAATFCSLWPAQAPAQQAVIGAVADVASGIEGGASGYAAGVRRARTTVRLGAQGYVDEYPENILALAALVEVEPTATIGADLRYIRMVADCVALHVGPVGVISPKHMLGATFGAAYQWSLTDSFALSFGPTGNVYFVGADLTGSSVLWQVLGQVGVRAEF